MDLDFRDNAYPVNFDKVPRCRETKKPIYKRRPLKPRRKDGFSMAFIPPTVPEDLVGTRKVRKRKTVKNADSVSMLVEVVEDRKVIKKRKFGLRMDADVLIDEDIVVTPDTLSLDSDSSGLPDMSMDSSGDSDPPDLPMDCDRIRDAPPDEGNNDEDGNSTESANSSMNSSSGADEEMPEDRRTKLAEELFAKFVVSNIRHNSSKAARQEFWAFLDKHADLIGAAKEVSRNRLLPSFQTCSKWIDGKLPPVTIDCAHLRRSSGQIKFDLDMTAFPRKEYRNHRRWALQYEYTRVSSVESIKMLHDLNGQKSSSSIILSVDGVPQDDSSGISLEIVAMRFEGCRCVFPLCIYREQPGASAKKTLKSVLTPVFEDIARSGCTVTKVIADAPYRCKLRNTMGHMSYYSCDYCFGKGTFGSGACAKKMHIGYRAARADKRTSAIHRQIANGLESGFYQLKRDREILKGVRGASLLFTIPELDVINDVPTEWMHMFALGFFKRLFELLFKVKAKDKNKFCQRADRIGIHIFNTLAMYIVGPSEFSRRIREMDYCNFKAQEWRNIAVVYFPVLLKSLHDRPVLLEVVHIMVYIVRAYLEDDAHFREVHNGNLKLTTLSEYFSKLYQKTFGKDNCTYNKHLFDHIDVLRQSGCLTETSAFPFEGFYNQYKQAYTAGTTSICKQGINNVMIRILEGGHTCEKSIKYKEYRDKDPSKCDDSLVYVEGDDFYRIRETYSTTNPITKRKTYGDKFKVSKVDVTNYSAVVNEGRTSLDFSEVGVYKLRNGKDIKDSTDDVTVEIFRKDILGKAVQLHGFIVTVPIHLLVEAD